AGSYYPVITKMLAAGSPEYDQARVGDTENKQPLIRYPLSPYSQWRKLVIIFDHILISLIHPVPDFVITGV
uniref:hypothetical protein n=1 Tax=Salmonella enterica TaxID=28901 RepID=UPI001C99DB6D